MNSYRIFIVEDETIAAMDIERRLDIIGYQPCGCLDNAEEAIDAIAKKQPDLVLMDIHLSGEMDGITAAIEIRRQFHIPVIFLTASTDDSTLNRAKLAEPFGYIIKPFNNYELKSTIEITLHKHKAEEELRRVNEYIKNQSILLQTLMDAIPSPIFYKDTQSRYIGCNKAYEKLSGIRRDELVGKTVYDIWHHDLAKIYSNADKKLLDSEDRQVYETEVYSNDGIRYNVLTHKAVFLNSDGKAGGVIGLIEDITERKMSEKKIARLTRIYQTLSDTNEAILRITDETVLLQHICDITFRLGGFCIVWIGMHDTTRNIIISKAIAGELAEKFQGLEFTIDVGTDKHTPFCDAFRKGAAEQNIASVVCLPIKRGGNIEGILGIGSNEVEYFDDDVVNLLDRMILNISFGLDNLKKAKERIQLENQFIQAQKMEAIGLLAGGVAHDFNNILSIILGYSEILLNKLPSNSHDMKYATEINHAGERAASLTRQLLAFSRKQILEPKVLDPNVIVENLVKMLKRLIGENIILTTILFPKISKVKVDPNQIEQALTNLAINARDSMHHGGYLTIETKNIELDKYYCDLHPGSKIGKYVMIDMIDTGCGIKSENIDRIFEPFFTTKETGKGTGLGLSMVFGVVKQSDGYIEVNSELGVGTSFKIYLPSIESKQIPKLSVNGIENIKKGQETILLVEDDLDVMKMIKLALQIHGYNVIEASDGYKAILESKKNNDKIHLLLTDVIMPEINGRELAEVICKSRSDLKVLFMSGYTDDEIMRLGITESNIKFIQKPFLTNALAKKVREVLDG